MHPHLSDHNPNVAIDLTLAASSDSFLSLAVEPMTKLSTARALLLSSALLASLFATRSLPGQTLNTTRVASGLDRPVYLTSAPGDNDRLFILEKNTGNIQILNTATGQLNSDPFLTVNDISSISERGLLGLAFHPDYQNNGLFYVNVTDAAGDTSIREYQRQSNDLAISNSRRNILSIAQPAANHNGGWMDFGQDGLLYISSGDGGGGSGPPNGQDTNTLLGSMLRIDINGDDFANDANRNYAIPSTNPFVGQNGADEILAYGLRNPWRASFDSLTGDLYIGDVGAGAREEIDIIPAGTTEALNFGWSDREGAPDNNKPVGFTDPIYDYLHGSGEFEGQSITGGYVYRGDIEELQGKYFFADFSQSKLWSLDFDGANPENFDGTNYQNLISWTDDLVADEGNLSLFSSFGEDNEGNLYLLSFQGDIFRISGAAVPEPASGLLVLAMAGGLMWRRRNR